MLNRKVDKKKFKNLLKVRKISLFLIIFLLNLLMVILPLNLIYRSIKSKRLLMEK
jgi:hypothetical protein